MTPPSKKSRAKRPGPASSRKRSSRHQSSVTRPFFWGMFWGGFLSFLAILGLAFWQWERLSSAFHVESPPVLAMEQVLQLTAKAVAPQKPVAVEALGVRQGVENWQVTLGSRAEKDALLEALQPWIQKQNWTFSLTSEKFIRSQPHQLMVIKQEGRERHKIVLRFDPDPPRPQAKGATAKPLSGPYVSVAQDRVPPTSPGLSEETKSGADPQSPRVAIVIDDVGMKPPEQLEPILSLNVPMTFAILPFQRYTSSCATFLKKTPYETILHLPMEPLNFPVANPGSGALFSSATRTELQNAFQDAVRDVPGVVGVNNHMGSRLTQDEALMTTVLEEIHHQGLFFIDSRTHAGTVAFQVAQKMDLPSAERDIFIDAFVSESFSLEQMQKAAALAKAQGTALAIGHPYPSTLNALAAIIPQLQSEGIVFVRASELVH